MDFKKLHWPGMTHFKTKCFFYPNATQLVARAELWNFGSEILPSDALGMLFIYLGWIR